MNVEGKIAGSTETPLTEEGRNQAKNAGKKLKELKIDYIVCSPQSRTKETAEIIAKELGYPLDKIHFNDLFVERDYGPMEGAAWHPDLNVDGIADVESADTLINRARLALNFLESLPEENILVVSHGSFGRALRHHILEDFPFSRKEDRIANAEVHEWL